MEIIRPSDHQLIFKAHGNMQQFLREFTSTATTPSFMVVIFVIVLFLRIVSPEILLSSSIIIALFPFVGCGCIGIATTRDHTTIFDLDLQYVRIECYWVLFKQRQYEQYDLINIRDIVVAEDSEVDWFYIRLRQHSGEDIYLSHSGDRSMTEAKAQEIRDFLGTKSQINWINLN